MSDRELGSSIPAGAAVYRFVPVKNFVNDTESFTATIVHEPRAFRTFRADGTPLSFLVNLKMHVAIGRIGGAFHGGRNFALTLAERLQVGYVYDGSVLRRAPGDTVFAPRTQTVELSDTTTSEAGVTVSEAGVSLSFGVTDSVTISVTDWLVALNPVSGHLMWDYYVNSPYSVQNGERPPEDRLDRLSNISLVGFSFDTVAWFEVFELNRPSVELRPVFSLRMANFRPRFYEAEILGDRDVTQPVAQPPLLVDLTKVPNRKLVG
jgi:hypothetical protein